MQRERIYEKRAEELKEKRYQSAAQLSPFAALPGTQDPDAVYRGEIPDFSQGGTFRLGDVLEGKNRYLWLQKELEIPAAPAGFESAVLFRFEKMGGRNQGRFEGMVYADGKLLQGIDENHTEILLGDREGQKICLTFLIWTGMEGGEGDFFLRLNQAEVVFLHKNTDRLYFFMKTAAQTVKLLPQTDTGRTAVMKMADLVLQTLDWDREGFYASADRGAELLEQELEKQRQDKDITVHAVGHTHIDVAWLWRLKHTREKAQRSFATVLRLMERYDDYIFLQSQPQLYQYLKEDCPEMYEKIREKVSQGRWEPEGGMWLEADCNIPSGESLVRQLLHGIRFFEKEFGKTCRYLWLPDVFGYSWALPQIMKLCGLETFMTTKISWNESNQIPEDLFWWKGIDGTRMLTYFIETPEEWRPDTDWFATYNGLLTPATLLGSWKKFKNQELSSDVMISYGYGDGGGGVTREMLEMRRVMDRMPGLPAVKTGTAGAFFDKIHENVRKVPQRVPVWDGELYLEFHRGTYTTQAYNKKMNRTMEGLLAQAEWLSCWNWVNGGSYETKQIQDCWEGVLLHQFHDIIPGSSIREVYEDSHKAYENLEAQAKQIRNEACNGLVGYSEGKYTAAVFDSFAREELLYLEQEETGKFYDGEQLLDTQKTEGGYWVKTQLEPLDMKEIAFCPGEEKEQEIPFEISLEDRQVITPNYKISWDEEGRLDKIYDRIHDREILKAGEKGNVLELYEDKPLGDDAWNIDAFYTEKMQRLEMTGEAVLQEIGSLLVKIRFRYVFGSSEIVQDMVLYRDSMRIDFETFADWRESHKLLKAAFYTDIRAVKATYDIQFGCVERPNHGNTSWDRAKFEVCAQRWADLSEHGYGISLLNDGKYGYNIRENAVKLSLLRAPKHPDPMADIGKHQFTYALFPHEGAVTDGGTVEEAAKLNQRPLILKDRSPKNRVGLFDIQADGVQIDAVKKAEDDQAVIIRLHEYKGGRGRAELLFAKDVQEAVVTDFLERKIEEEIPVSISGRSVQLRLKPFEIKTLKVRIS